MGVKDRETKGKKNIRHGKRMRLFFLAEWFVLIAFILAAFFLPQGIFHIQDNILYTRTMLSAREKIDAEALSTTYERSFPLRMLHFAECLEAGDNFYVTSQEIPITQEVYDYLYSDSLLYDGIATYFSDIGLLSTALIWEEGVVNQWKQYVIYSDDYTKGVNFILWYIELQDSEGEILKILADAETKIIYALKEENSFYLQDWIMGGYYSQSGLFCYRIRGIEMWYALASYYDAVDTEAFFVKYGTMNEKELAVLAEEMGPDEAETYLLEYFYGFGWTEREWEDKPENFSDEKNMFSFRLVYEERPFEVVLDLREAYIDIKKPEREKYYGGVSILPDITIGFQQIYELIPEFN